MGEMQFTNQLLTVPVDCEQTNRSSMSTTSFQFLKNLTKCFQNKNRRKIHDVHKMQFGKQPVSLWIHSEAAQSSLARIGNLTNGLHFSLFIPFDE